MGLTKPAGCLLQLIALVVLFSGWGACLSGMTASDNGRTAIGVIVVIVGTVLFWLGRQPAVESARARGAGAKMQAPTPAPTRKCPMCAETILVEAKKCKHCGSILNA
jgi:hypothetical protein